MGTRVLAVSSAVLTALLPAVLLAGPAGSADVPPAKAYGRDAVAATNHARADHDLAALAGQRCLRAFARAHAKEMAQAGEIWHQDLQAPLDECGINFVGENVAYGYADGEAVVDQGWMKSKGHRANILEPDFELVAVVARRGADDRWYACQLFGRPD